MRVCLEKEVISMQDGSGGGRHHEEGAIGVGSN